MRRLYNRTNSAVQKVVTFDKLLTFRTGSGAAKTINFQIKVPDSRLRVKVTVPFVQSSGVATSGLTATLWLREADQDESGVGGGLIPCADIEGTSGAPTVIPISAGLQGYSREFITAADYILGTLVVTSSGPSAGGSWNLQTRFQPQAVKFADDEWAEIASGCDVSAESLID